MQQTIGAFRKSVTEGFVAASVSYNQWYELGSGLLVALRDTDDPTSLILGAFWLGDVCLSKVIIPLHLYPDTPRSFLPTSALRQMGQWLQAIEQGIEARFKSYLQWPNEIMARLEALLIGIETPTTTGFSPNQKAEIIANISTRYVSTSDSADDGSGY
jgi:hypothetical protein